MVRNSALSKIVEKPISGEWGLEGSNVNVIRTTNFTNEGVLDLTDVATRNIDQKKVNKKQLLIGDVIIEKSGGSPTQPVGRVVYFEAQGDYLCNNFTAVLRPKPNEVEGKYLLYILFANHKYGVTLKFQNKTTGIINLQLNRYLEEVKVPLPPLQDQKKIAAILDAADDYRQKTKVLINKYDQLTQSLFLDMFGDPVTNPKGWEVKQLKQILNPDRPLTYGILKPEEHNIDGVVMLRIQDIKGSKVNRGEFHKVSRSLSQQYKRTILNGGEIVISLVGTIGLTAKIGNHLKDANLHRNLGLISLDENMILQDYFFNYTLSKGFTFQIKSLTKGGNQPLLNLGSLEKLEVKIPPLELQNQFAERIAQIEKQKQQAEESLVKAEELFNSLLQRAFKGELTN